MIILILVTLIFIINMTPKHSFKYLKILDENIRLKSKKYNYNIEIDCQKLKEPNIQIIDYKLIKRDKDNKISISTKLFDNNDELIEEYDNISKMIIDIDNEKDTYNIIATCK